MGLLLFNERNGENSMEGLKKGILVKNNVAVGAVGDKNFSTAPIGVIQAFSGTTIPNGYLVADGASYKVADYPDLYAVIGNTYGGDTENFNVPNLVDKFIEGSTASGTEKEAGLPNITGSFVPWAYQNNLNPSGAFSQSYTNVSAYDAYGVNKGSQINFNANQSNSIYGNSDTVQPPALTMVYIIKAFHTNEGVDSGVSDDVIEYVNNKISSNLGELENITKLTDFDEAIPEKGKNKIYYVNKIIGTYECAQWRVESMYYDVSGLKQYRGVQKATSINGVDNIMLMREYYLDDNNVMHWGAWIELATMDKVVKYPDWSNQQMISLTEITVDQDVYIELNQLSSSPIEALKINGKDVSVSDTENGFYSTRFSGYVKKGSFVSYPYLTDPKIVRVFPLV